MYETAFVLGLTNFLGLIFFFEKVPKPRISTLLSKATASVIVVMIVSIALDIFILSSCGNSRDSCSSRSDLLKVSNFLVS